MLFGKLQQPIIPSRRKHECHNLQTKAPRERQFNTNMAPAMKTDPGTCREGALSETEMGALMTLRGCLYLSAAGERNFLEIFGTFFL